MNKRVRILIGVAVLIAIGAAVWWYIAAGRESTDGAQVDAHITPIAARVGGTVLHVPVEQNQEVEAGAVLVEIDKRDYEIALERAPSSPMRKRPRPVRESACRLRRPLPRATR